jgi:hypothetical protein
MTANLAAAGFAVCGCCSVAFAASLHHGLGLWRAHISAGDPVVIVRGDGAAFGAPPERFEKLFGHASRKKPQTMAA